MVRRLTVRLANAVAATLYGGTVATDLPRSQAQALETRPKGKVGSCVFMAILESVRGSYFWAGACHGCRASRRRSAKSVSVVT